MEGSSNQDLWKILIGHSALRDPALIKAEVLACRERLLKGLSYYQKPSAASLKKLEKSQDVKGSWRKFVLEVSKYLDLDQLQSLELFQSFLCGVYRGSLSELNQRLATDKDHQSLLSQVNDYYLSERLHLLKCIKCLLGYWQDSNHPYREVYEQCVNEINKDESALIKSVWKQYEELVASEMPNTVQGQQEEASWLIHVLKEQCELLEIVLLYFKDYTHTAPDLLATATRFQSLGFGRKQHSRVGLVPAAEPLLNHISHLCSLILVEGACLEWVELYMDQPEELARHHLLQSQCDAQLKDLDDVILKWGDVCCHGPVLLAWMAFKFIAQPRTELERVRLLGNKALQTEVFGYLLEIVQSPFFAGDRPVASISKCVLHTLLSLCVSAFNEDSLGDPADLVALATETLTHPRLRLEFWEKGLNTGVGLLLHSAELRFPLDLTSILGLLLPLSCDPLSAQNVFHHLTDLPVFCEKGVLSQLHQWVEPAEEEEGLWVLTVPRVLYSKESQHLGRPGLTLPPGTCASEISPNVISWSHRFSGWEVFVLETCKVLHSPRLGTDPTPHPQTLRAAEVAKLVTQLLKHDWSLAPYLQPITSQYFNIIQTCSSLPNPPPELLAACLECIAVMATKESALVWQQLGRTGFLPYLTSTVVQVKSISVAPGHYGQILNVWERPRGIYPTSMAMLDLLLSMSQPSNSLATNEMLACVVFIMREMFPGSHNWRYRHMTNREEIGHKLLQLCHNILRAEKKEDCLVYSFVCYFLLHLSGGQALLSTLAVGVDVVNALCSNQQNSQSVVQVESLKLAFKIIDLLLQAKRDQVPTPLEQALATQSLKQRVDSRQQVHLVAVIASYIHHHDDPHVPAGATKLLTRLSQVAPMSVFACLGQEALAIRDAYTNRLRAHVEDTELKVAILDLVTECVASQPSMSELFLSVRPRTASDKDSSHPTYALEPESCLHAVLELMDPENKQAAHTPPSLLQAAMALLRGLWVGRHDAALIALRSQKDFWKHLTKPLFKEVSLEDSNGDTADMLLVCSHVMHIVAMETYYVLRRHMDKELQEVLKKFASSKSYKSWTKCLHSAPTSDDSAHPDLSHAQYELSVGVSTFLLVASSNEELYRLDHTHQPHLLEDILSALESQLKGTSAVPEVVVAIATELSSLYMILSRKWSCETTRGVVCAFNHILPSAGRIDPQVGIQLTSHLYSSLVQLLRNHTENLEPRFVLGLVTSISETLQHHHLYSTLACKHRPDVISIYLLKEIVQYCSTSDPTAGYLQTLRENSSVAILLRTMDEHMRLKTDPDFIEATLGFFLSLSKTKAGTEVLLINEIAQSLSISLADALLSVASTEEKQVYLQWQKIWHLALKLTTSLLDRASHHFVPSALNFTGVHQERIAQALDIFHVMKDLTSLEETSSVCQFLYQLSRYKQQWRFTLPSLHNAILERVVYLTSSTTAILSNRANLKHIVKTMHASGALPQEYGPSAPAMRGRGRVRTLSGGRGDMPDSWVTSSPAFSQLLDSLVSILTSCLASLRHYTPPLDSILLEGVLDPSEYPPLFSLSMAPPTPDYTTPPSLATLTTCLTTTLNLMNKLEPHRAGTPSKSPGSSAKSPGNPRHIANAQKKLEYLFLLEQAVFLLLSQGTLYLLDPTIETQDKQVLKKYLSNALDHFSNDLLRNFTRKGLPSPKSATPTSRGHTHFQDSTSSKGSSLSFTDSQEQRLFKMADLFAKQFFR